MKIINVTAREILDSRGNPTVAASVELADGVIAEASVPSGASTGSSENKELRDGDPARYGGQGELKAVKNIEEIIGPALVGMDATDQWAIDERMIALDGTTKKEKLGANSILAVSLATARAAAISADEELFEYLAKIHGNKKLKLPTPMFNILNGGKHAENNVDIQETMIVPTGLSTFTKKLEAGSEIYHTLKQELVIAGYQVGLGDEGGFAPNLDGNEEVFKWVEKAIKAAGYPKEKIRISIDAAATEFFNQKIGKYQLQDDKKILESDGLIALEKKWAKKYSLLSIEDGLAEDDNAWKKLTKSLGTVFTVGDDLFTTDAEKIALGCKEKMAGGVIIKPNQIGTLSETLAAIKAAQKGKIKVIVSHRSGETEDPFIADLAVAVGADFIKSGAPARSERLAKYNRLTKIESILSE